MSIKRPKKRKPSKTNKNATPPKKEALKIQEAVIANRASEIIVKDRMTHEEILKEAKFELANLVIAYAKLQRTFKWTLVISIGIIIGLTLALILR